MAAIDKAESIFLGVYFCQGPSQLSKTQDHNRQQIIN